MKKSGHLRGSTWHTVQAHRDARGSCKQESSDTAAGTAPVLRASTAVPLPGSQVTSLLRDVWCPAGASVLRAAGPGAGRDSELGRGHQLRVGKLHVPAEERCPCCIPSDLQAGRAEGHWSTWEGTHWFWPTFLRAWCGDLTEYICLWGQLDWVSSSIVPGSRSQGLQQMPSHFAEGKVKTHSLDWLHR